LKKREEVERILVERCGITETEAEVFVEYLAKEELTQQEAEIVDDIYAHLVSFWNGRNVEAAIHSEMMGLGIEYKENPEAMAMSFKMGFILPAEVNV